VAQSAHAWEIENLAETNFCRDFWKCKTNVVSPEHPETWSYRKKSSPVTYFTYLPCLLYRVMYGFQLTAVNVAKVRKIRVSNIALSVITHDVWVVNININFLLVDLLLISSVKRNSLSWTKSLDIDLLDNIPGKKSNNKKNKINQIVMSQTSCYWYNVVTLLSYVGITARIDSRKLC